jgi:hypothetical protein
VDGLPYHNVTPINNASVSSVYQNPGYWGAIATGTTTADYVNQVTLYTAPPPSTTVATVRNLATNGVEVGRSPDIYKMGPNASQVEGGTYDGIVSWGRWAGTVQQVGGYNNGQSFFNFVTNGLVANGTNTALSSGLSYFGQIM